MKLNPELTIDQHKAGGDGETEIRRLLDAEKLNNKCGMFSEVTLKKGCSIGVHEHHGNTETYYILSGEGTYTDDEEVYSVAKGDITYCADGHKHGLANAGDEPLVFMALIINS